MAVQVKLSGTKQISNTSLTSIVEFTNFNISQIVSSVQDFLKSINYVEGQDSVSVEISSIDADSVQIRQGLSVLGTQLNNGNLEEVIRLEPSGSIIGKNLLVNDVMQGLRLRLRVFGIVPPTGIPGEVIYVQDQPDYAEGFYGYLAGHGWVCLSCADTTGGGGNCCCNKENIIYTDAVSTVGDAHEMPQTLSLGLEPALGTGFMLFVNGVQMEVGDGVTTAPVYLSEDGGLTAINFSEATTSSQFYWNYTYAGFNLDSQDRLTLRYIAIDPFCNDTTSTTTSTLPPVSTTSTTAAPTTISTTATPTTNAPCAQDMIVAVQDPSSPTTRVTFTGNPTGPFQVSFVDAYGQYHFLTVSSNVTLPWVFDLSQPAYSSLPTVQGTYTFTSPVTGCQYIKTVGVPSLTTTTSSTTTSSSTTTTQGTTLPPTTRCDCEYYSIRIREVDLLDATGNSIGADGQVWVSYYDCNGNLTDKIYEVAGDYDSDICASTIAEPAVYYYKNDTLKINGSSSAIPTGVCCNAPTTTTGGSTTTACPCTFYTITIGESDISSAISNTAYDTYTVYVNYLNCNNEPIEKKYTTAGVYENDLCVKVGSVPLVTYFRNDSVRAVSASSAVNTLACCSQLVSTTSTTAATSTSSTSTSSSTTSTSSSTTTTSSTTTSSTTESPTTTTTDPCLRVTITLNEVNPGIYELQFYGSEGRPFEVYQRGASIFSGFTPGPIEFPIENTADSIWIVIDGTCEYELVFNPDTGWRMTVAQTSTTTTYQEPTTTEPTTTASTTQATTTSSSTTTTQATTTTSSSTTTTSSSTTTTQATTTVNCNPDTVSFAPDGRGGFYLTLTGYPTSTGVTIVQDGLVVVAGPYPAAFVSSVILNPDLSAFVYIGACEYEFVYDPNTKNFIYVTNLTSTTSSSSTTTSTSTTTTTIRENDCTGKTARLVFFAEPDIFRFEATGYATDQTFTIVQDGRVVVRANEPAIFDLDIRLFIDLPVTVYFGVGCYFELFYDDRSQMFTVPLV